MANRFNQLLPGQQYQSIYVPLPFDDILRAGAMKQKGHDDNMAALKAAKPNDLTSIKYHDEARNKIMQQFSNEAMELTKKHRDMGSWEAKQDIDNLTYRWANDPSMQALKRSETQFKAYWDDRRALEKTGKYAPWNDQMNQRLQAAEMGNNTFLDANGNPVEFNYTGLGERQVHEDPIYKYFDKMKEDGTLNDIVSFDKLGNIIGTKDGWEGIGSQKVANLADNFVNNYLYNTAEGKDWAKKMVYEGQVSTKEELEDAAKQYLRTLGAAYVHGKTTYAEDFQYRPAWMAEEEKEKLKTRPTTVEAPIEEAPVDATGMYNLFGKDLTNVTYDGMGNIVAKKGKATNNPKPTKTPGMTEQEYKLQLASWEKNKGITQEEADQIAKQQQQFTFNLRVKFPELNRTNDGKARSDREILNMWNNGIKDYTQQSLKDINISPEAKVAVKEELALSLGSRSYKVVNSKGEDTTVDKLFEELGYDYDDADDFKAVQESIRKNADARVQPLGKWSGSYVLNIPKKNGGTVRVYTSPDVEQKKAYQTSKSLKDLMDRAAGDPTFTGTLDSPIFEFAVQPAFTNGKIMPTIKAKHKDTGDIYDMTLEEAIQADADAWHDSKFIRSNDTTDNKKKP